MTNHEWISLFLSFFKQILNTIFNTTTFIRLVQGVFKGEKLHVLTISNQAWALFDSLMSSGPNHLKEKKGGGSILSRGGRRECGVSRERERESEREA